MESNLKMTFFAEYVSPLGGIVFESDGSNLTAVWFPGQRDAAPDGERAELPVFSATRRWLDVYFSGRDPGVTPPLAMKGSPFQRAVWELLKRIPYGATTTYGALAKEIARSRGLPRMSAQAVGGAVGSNPIAILVPCHRVLGASGRLTGYAGGMDKKVRLLEFEGFRTTGDAPDSKVLCFSRQLRLDLRGVPGKIPVRPTEIV